MNDQPGVLKLPEPKGEFVARCLLFGEVRGGGSSRGEFFPVGGIRSAGAGGEDGIERLDVLPVIDGDSEVAAARIGVVDAKCVKATVVLLEAKEGGRADVIPC